MSGTTAFFVQSRAAPGAGEPGPALTAAHWSYMDRFADGMIARGPMLTPDRETWTGSVHIVGLPGVDAARPFVEDPRFMVVVRVPAGAGDHVPSIDLPPERLIVHGELRSPDDGRPVGVVLALHAASRQAVDAIVRAGHVADRLDVQIDAWELGGRR